MPLEDDIARVAALRGRSVADVERAAAERRANPHLAPVAIANILSPAPDPTQDLRWYDMLTPKSRRFIREQDGAPLNAAAWAWALHELGDEDALIALVTAALRGG